MADTEQEGDTGRVRDCLFCKIVAGEVPSDIVHSTPTTLAFKDIAPAAPLHSVANSSRPGGRRRAFVTGFRLQQSKGASEG